jgi:uncharacterized MAPEG superfamily protein
VAFSKVPTDIHILGHLHLRHFAKMGILTRASGKFSNANEQGRINLAELDGKVPKSTLACAQRCGAAHANGLESLAMYASGVAVAVVTKVPTSLLTKVCAGYLVSRIVFTVTYMMPPAANGLPRTLAWFGSTAFALNLWIQAAQYAVL